MPTGYTEIILEGASFEEFVMRCVKATGICLSLKDRSLDSKIPEKFEIESRYQNQVKELEKILRKIESMSWSEVNEACEKEYKEDLRLHKEGIIENIEKKDKYTRMLTKVECWNPPTDEHHDLKKFMIDQIKGSMEDDCTTLVAPRAKKDPQTWLLRKTMRTLESLKYARESLREEKSRVEKRNNYLKKLRESIYNKGDKK